MKSSLLKKLIVATFLSVPAVSSVISTIHLVDLFNLGNPTWLSILLAVTFELGSIASLLAISVIERIKVGAIWFIFFILSGLQIIGNVYYSYSFTSDQLLSNPTFLTNFMDLFSFITGEEIRDVKIFLSCIIGIPIPLIALFFLKSNIDYLKPAENNEKASSDPSPKSFLNSDKETNINDQRDSIEDQQKRVDALSRLAQDLGMYEMDEDEQKNDTMEESIYVDSQEIQDHSAPLSDEEPEHFDEVKIRRNPRPMISERRSDSIAALQRG